MKNWKKHWKNELDAMLPEMREDVREEPIVCAGYTENKQSFRSLLFAVPSGIAIACVIMITVIAALLGGNHGAGGKDFIVCAVTLEINPKVTFVTDKEGNVSSVIAMNGDADVIISDAERYASLEGEKLAEAVSVFTQYAVQSGFLNLDSPDAVRLSATGDCSDEWLKESVCAIEEYFNNKRISSVVIAEIVEIEKFCIRSGIDALKSKDALSEWIKHTSSFYIERESELPGEENLADTYREIFVDDIFKSELVSHLEAYVGDVFEIYELSLGILGAAFSDYWSITESNIPIFAPDAEEAGRLIVKMEEALLSFERNYGIKIDSAEKLSEATFKINDMVSEFLSLWESDVNQAVAMMEEKGICVNMKIRELITSIPEDTQTFVSAAKDAYSIKYDSLVKKSKEEYERERPTVDYSGLKAFLIEEYGSLEEFFKEKNK